jgi:putative colanic acid biosynthesis acetyltransferase WcaF
MSLDIARNRKSQKYSRTDLVKRILWIAGSVLFRLAPRPLFGFRRLILRCFGAKVGTHVNTYSSTRIYFPWNLEVGDWSAIGENVLIYNLGPVTIGTNVTISHSAHLCAGTHDYTKPDMPLLKPPITIGDQAWICADAFVGPGVTVGEGAIVGARAVAMNDVEPWSIVAGNPAAVIKRRHLTTDC